MTLPLAPYVCLYTYIHCLILDTKLPSMVMATNQRLLRSIRGKKAQRSGASFEMTILGSAYQKGLGALRIPDGCKQLTGGRIIRVKSPFDFVIFDGPLMLFCDAKSVSSTNFNKSMVNEDQVRELLKFEKQGHAAGYIVYYKARNEVYFYTATQLASLKERESLKPNEGLPLGSLFEIDLARIFALHGHVLRIHERLTALLERYRQGAF